MIDVKILPTATVSGRRTKVPMTQMLEPKNNIRVTKLRARLQLVLIIVALSWPWAASYSAPPLSEQARLEESRAAEFVQMFSVIRVGITSAPGNGHQAHTIVVMKRLRELGFKGRFEILYVPAVKAKLGYLLPGFNPQGPKTQRLDEFRATAIEWDRSGGADVVPLKPSALGIMGGDDTHARPQDLKVDALIHVPPSGWGKPEAGFLDLPGATFELKDLPTHLMPTSISDSNAFLEKQMTSNPDMAKKLPGLRALFTEKTRFEIMAAYGLTKDRGSEKLARIIHSVSQARLQDPSLFKGPVVIPLLSGFDQEAWAQFHKTLENLGEPHVTVKVQGTAESEVSKTIHSLYNTDVLVMEVGSVPQDVWDALIDMSTLPPTVAGTTSVNYAKERGKPYFQTQGHDVLVRGTASNLEELTKKAHQEMLGKTNQEDAGTLKDLILAAMRPNSELNAAFQNQSLSHDRNRDKVSATISASREHLEKQVQILDEVKSRTLHELIEGALGNDPAIARLSVFSLKSSGSYSDQVIFEALHPALHDSSEKRAITAAALMAEFKLPGALEALTAEASRLLPPRVPSEGPHANGTHTKKVAIQVLKSLALLDKDAALPHLIRGLKQSDKDLTLFAGDTLLEFSRRPTEIKNTEGLFDALVTMVSADGIPESKASSAFSSLPKIPDEKKMTAVWLSAFLDDPRATIRNTALFRLSRSPKNLPPLKKQIFTILQDPSIPLRQTAIYAVSQLDYSPEALEALRSTPQSGVGIADAIKRAEQVLLKKATSASRSNLPASSCEKAVLSVLTSSK